MEDTIMANKEVKVCDRKNLKKEVNEKRKLTEAKDREIYFVNLKKSGLFFIKGYRESNGVSKELLLEEYINPKEIADLEIVSDLYYKVSHTLEYGEMVETKPQQVVLKKTPQQIVSKVVSNSEGIKKEEDNEIISKDGSVCIKCRGSEELDFVLNVDNIIKHLQKQEDKNKTLTKNI